MHAPPGGREFFLAILASLGFLTAPTGASLVFLVPGFSCVWVLAVSLTMDLLRRQDGGATRSGFALPTARRERSRAWTGKGPRFCSQALMEVSRPAMPSDQMAGPCPFLHFIASARAQPHRLESPLSRPAQPCPRQVLAWEADLLPSPTTRRRVALSAGSFCSSSFPFPLRPSRLPGFRSLPQSPTIPQTPAVTMRRSGRWQQPRGKQRQPQLRRRPAGQCLTRILVSSHSLLRPSFGSEQQQRSSRGGRRRRSRERGWERWNRRFFPRSSSSGPSRFDEG